MYDVSRKTAIELWPVNFLVNFVKTFKYLRHRINGREHDNEVIHREIKTVQKYFKPHSFLTVVLYNQCVDGFVYLLM